MGTIEVWLIAVGLAMDCLAVSITSGVFLKRIHWPTIARMAFSFGFFQGFMPFIGWLGASRFSQQIQDIDHWIAFVILAFLGGKMIIESFKNQEEKQEFNPSNPKVVLALSIATSIDALAIGVTFAFLDMTSISQILLPIGIIGIVSFIMSIAGFVFGTHFGSKYNLRMELWGGIILTLIGIKILIEHLFFN